MQADVNVALTAMSLLWNAADLLSKMHLQAGDAGTSAQEIKPKDFEELLRLLLGALQVCTGPEQDSCNKEWCHTVEALS